MTIGDRIKDFGIVDFIKLVFSIIVGCLTSYFYVLESYSKHGCTNAFNVIIGNGILGFITFIVGSIFGLACVYVIGDVYLGIKGFYTNSDKLYYIKEKSVSTIKSTFSLLGILFLVLLAFLIGGVIAGYILNWTIC